MVNGVQYWREMKECKIKTPWDLVTWKSPATSARGVLEKQEARQGWAEQWMENEKMESDLGSILDEWVAFFTKKISIWKGGQFPLE